MREVLKLFNYAFARTERPVNYKNLKFALKVSRLPGRYLSRKMLKACDHILFTLQPNARSKSQRNLYTHTNHAIHESN